MGITTEQFQEMKRRTDKARGLLRDLPLAEPHEGRERDLHDQIEADLKSRRWLYFHGATSFRTKRTLGEPDFQVYGSKGRFWLIEVKNSKGKLSLEQMAVGLLAESLGHKVNIIRSFKEYLNLVD